MASTNASDFSPDSYVDYSFFHDKTYSILQQNTCSIRDFRDIVQLGLCSRNRQAETVSGDETLATLHYLLDLGHPKRVDYQIEIHEIMINSLLPRIYGKSWAQNAARVCRERGITMVKQQTLTNMPRRTGKSLTMMRFTTRAFMAIANMTALIFATGQEMANELLNVGKAEFYDLLDELGLTIGPDIEIHIDTKKEFAFVYEMTMRKMKSLPSASGNEGRGYGADIIIIDEAAYVRASLIMGTAMPMAIMRSAALFLISTPSSSLNHFTRLMSFKSPTLGESPFNIINKQRICSECMKLPLSQRLMCTHATWVPPWHSEEKMAIFKEIYMFLMPEAYEREILSIASDGSGEVFNTRKVNELFQQFYTENPNKPDPERCKPLYEAVAKRQAVFEAVYMYVDPCGESDRRRNQRAAQYGGDSSLLAIVSCAVVQHVGDYVILGIDARRCYSIQERRNILKEHIESLLSIPYLRSCPIIVVPERSLGFESSQIVNDVKSIPHTMDIYYYENEGNIGVRKTEQVSINMINMLNRLLEDERLYLDVNWFTCSGDYEKFSLGGRDHIKCNVLRECAQQLNQHRRNFEGKVECIAQHNDIAVCIQMMAYWTPLIGRDNMTPIEHYGTFENHLRVQNPIHINTNLENPRSMVR